MASWPNTAELAQVLNIAPDAAVDEWQTTLDRVLASAIYKVQHDVGQWDEYENEPDDNLAQAALRMAELISLRPAAATETSKDPAYLQLLFGHRKRFAVA